MMDIIENLNSKLRNRNIFLGITAFYLILIFINRMRIIPNYSTIFFVFRLLILICFLFYIVLYFIENILKKKFSLDIFDFYCIFLVLSNWLGLLIQQVTDPLDYAKPVLYVLSFFSVKMIIKYFKGSEKLLKNLLVVFFSFSVFHFFMAIILFFIRIDSFKSLSKMSPVAIGGIMNGLGKSQNDITLFLLIGLMSIVLYFFIYKQDKFQYLIIYIIYSIYIVATVSRGGILGLTVFSFVFLILVLIYDRKFIVDNKKKLLFVLVAGSLVLSVFELKFNVVGNILQKNEVQGTTYRWQTWKGFWNEYTGDLTQIRVYLGEGGNSLKNTVSKYFGPSVHVHNFLLEIWGRYGIINLISTLLLIIYLLKYHFINRKFIYFFAVIIAMLSREFFEVILFADVLRWEMFFFWFILMFPYYNFQMKDNR